MEKKDTITIDESLKDISENTEGITIQNEPLDEPSIHDTDGNEMDIDRIRVRTFNDELKELVAKIRTNETLRHDESKSLDEISEEELLQRFHKLFYKSVNLIGLKEDVNTSFNQFIQSDGLFSGNIEQEIHQEMMDLSLTEYSILSYSIENMCFTPLIHHINDLDKKNVAIDTSEELYSRIMENRSGFYLDFKTINNSAYLKKRFTSKENENHEDALLFFSCRNLFRDLYSDISNITDKIAVDTGHFPIIMIRINSKNEDISVHEVNEKIKNRLSVKLLFLERKILSEIHDSRCYSLDNALNFLDYNFKIYSNKYDIICMIIEFTNSLDKLGIFLYKYFYIKLKNSLSAVSNISRIEKDRVILFILRSEKKIVEEIIQEFNRYYNDIFLIKELTNKDNLSLVHLFQKWFSDDA